MKRIATRAMCLIFAGAMCLSLAACSDSSASSSSLAATSSTSEEAVGTMASFGAAADFDYANFSYSQSIDENGMWSGISALDYVTLPDAFNALPIPSADVVPTEEEVQSEIDSYVQDSAVTQQVTDRAAVSGDSVNIDYAGTVDGIVFTGGTSTGYNITLGSGTFIDTFEDQIIGHVPGDKFDVTVTFPEGYSDSTDADGNAVALSNKEAVFAVTLNYISESVVPELSDEWVEANYGTENDVHTVEQMQTIVREGMLESNKQSYLMDYLLKNSTFSEMPASLIDYQVCECLSYYNYYASMYGTTLDEFIQGYVGYDSADAMLAELEANIIEYSQQSLVYQAIAEKLGLAVTAADLEPYADSVESYGEPYLKMYVLNSLSMTEISKNAQLV